MPRSFDSHARTLHLALALGLSLIACNSSEGPTADESGSPSSSGSSSADSGVTPDSSTDGPSASSGSPTEDLEDTTTGSSGGDDEPTGTTSGTTGPVCALEDDNVACDALVGGGDSTFTDRPTPTRMYEGPSGFTSPPAPAPPACDIFAQDCPAGMKCNPYADDGGQIWNATGCFEVSPAPAKVDEACSSQGTSGVDSCEAGAFCMYDPLQSGYYCEPMCGCSEKNPTCDAGDKCTIFNNGVLPLCFTLCDPLAPSACAGDEVCAFTNYQFICRPDASAELGQLGDPCMASNQCAAGHSCEVAPYVPGGCDDEAQHCCTPLCELSAPDCPAGSHCLEYFPGFGLETPVCLEDVGYCIADDAPLVDAPARLR